MGEKMVWDYYKNRAYIKVRTELVNWVMQIFTEMREAFFWQLYCKDESILPTFYQRDDTLALYEAIFGYVSKYINVYYGEYGSLIF